MLYKKHPVGYIVADFYIPQQKNFSIKEDLIIETKQAALDNKIEYLSQLKIYLKSRAKYLSKESICKAMLIQWNKKDHLSEDGLSLKFSSNIKVEVWELNKNKLNMIWSSENND